MSNRASLNDSGGAVQPTPVQPMQAGRPRPPAPGEGAVASRVSTMFSVGFRKKLDEATMGELLDSDFRDVSVTVSRHRITMVGPYRPAVEDCHHWLMNEKLTDDLIDNIHSMETFTVHPTSDFGTNLRRVRRRPCGGSTPAHHRASAGSPATKQRGLDGDGPMKSPAPTPVGVDSTLVQAAASAASSAPPPVASAAAPCAHHVPPTSWVGACAAPAASSAPPPVATAAAPCAHTVPPTSGVRACAAPAASPAPPPVATAAAPCAHTVPPPSQGTAVVGAWLSEAHLFSVGSALRPVLASASAAGSTAAAPLSAAGQTVYPPPPPGPPPGPQSYVWGPPGQVHAPGLAGSAANPVHAQIFPYGPGGSAVIRAQSVPVQRQDNVKHADTFAEGAARVWGGNCEDTYVLNVCGARATVFPGRGPPADTSVIFYIPGSGGIPEKLMDFTSKEMKASRLLEHYQFHTILFVMEPTTWKKPVKDCVVELLQALVALKPAGREIRFIGFSRGAWWGTEILRRLDPEGLDSVLLVAAYGSPSHAGREGEEIGKLLARCGRGLMVVSLADTCNPWATWGHWLTGVQNLSQRVIVVDKLSHEQLRTVLVVGSHVAMDGAEDPFLERIACRL